MLSLREIQERAYRAFVLEESVALPDLLGEAANIAAGIGVYRNNARGIFLGALGTAFPAVARLVGEDCFRSLALTFMWEFPSRHGDLGRYGAEFPLLLEIFFRDTAYAYLPDIASLEWAIAEVELVAEDEPLALERLIDVAPDAYPRLRFRWQSAARLLGSRFPVHSIWRAQQEPGVPTVELGSAEHVLIQCRGGAVEVAPLAPASFAFAAALADGERLEDALAAAIAAAPDFDPGVILPALAERGLLVDVYFE